MYQPYYQTSSGINESLEELVNLQSGRISALEKKVDIQWKLIQAHEIARKSQDEIIKIQDTLLRINGVLHD